MKTLVIVCKKTGRVICVFVITAKNKISDFSRNLKIHMLESTQAAVDTGFIGIDKYHKNSFLPKKSSKKQPLAKEDKLFNQIISRVNESQMNTLSALLSVSKSYPNAIVTVENASVYASI